MLAEFPLRQAAETVREGGIVAYPTEAVYGLGCDPLNAGAVARLLAIKQRPVHKGLILLGADLEQLRPFMDLPETALAPLRDWPVGTTYLVPASALVPAWIRGEHHKVAVRVSHHPLAARLAQLAGTPLVSTSANLSGRPSLRNPFQVGRQLGPLLDYIVTGQCDITDRPSAIIDLESGATLRR
ncbi:MAG: L-threonylcarbamoyladenylate synthase [Alcanivoracaceae bacterium]